MAERRSRTGFGPVVVVGLAASALTAVSSAKPWYAAAVDFKAVPGARLPDASADMPLALALSLVVLAAWGVVLVTGTTGRRIALVVAALGSAGVLGCVAAAPSVLPDQIREQLAAAATEAATSPTGWIFVAGVSALIALVAAVVGWRAAPAWPAMGSRYDAPTGAAVDDTDLWKAMDAGHDPTERRDPDAP